MFGAATNTNKFCTATGGLVLASGEHVTGGLVAAAARGRLYQLFAHCFYNLALGLVAAPGISKVYSCA